MRHNRLPQTGGELESEDSIRMEKMNSQFLNAAPIGMHLDGSRRTRKVEPHLPFPDLRVARLLLVIRQLELRLASFEDLSDSDLMELISCAIVACGFTEPAETRCAIAQVLEAIEASLFRSAPSSDAVSLS
jgi:hypothetical protein